MKTLLTIVDLLKGFETDDQARANLKDENKTPLIDKKVIFHVNGKQYEKTTDTKGDAYLPINLLPRDYECSVEFKGDAKYNPSKADFRIKVVGKPSRLEAQDASFINGSGGQYIVKLTKGDMTPLKYYPIHFTINGVTYEKYTNDNGIAGLPINLNSGTYNINVKFNGTDNYHVQSENRQITVTNQGTSIQLTRMEVTQGEDNVVRLVDSRGVPLLNQTIHFFANGVEYLRQTDNDGYARLQINLNPREYNNTYHFTGQGNYNRFDIAGKLNVKAKPAPKPACNREGNWYINRRYAENKSTLAQQTDYDCGPNALKLCIYQLTGELLTNRQLMDWCGTGYNGTGHPGLEAGLAKAGKFLSRNFKINWYNLSDIGWQAIANACCEDNKAVFIHDLYKYQYGHYENVVGVNISSSTVKISNSLSDGYSRGWLENRSFSLCQGYMNGISQKSVAIITLV